MAVIFNKEFIVKKRQPKLVVPELPADGFHEYMAIGNQCWGRGKTVNEAKKNLTRSSGFPPSKIMVVPKGSWINEIGNQMLWRLEVAGEIHKDGRCPACRMD